MSCAEDTFRRSPYNSYSERLLRQACAGTRPHLQLQLFSVSSFSQLYKSARPLSAWHGLSTSPCCYADAYPLASAPLIDQYIAANGIILGKTNLGELQSGGSTNPTASGVTTITSTNPPNPVAYEITTALNPHDPTRTPSGKPLASTCRMMLSKA